MTLDTVGRRHDLPEVVLGDEREELETESGFETVRFFACVLSDLASGTGKLVQS